MSDSFHPADDAGLFGGLLWTNDDPFRNHHCLPLWKKNSSVLPEEGTSWARREDYVAMSIVERLETQSNSNTDVVRVQGCEGDKMLANIGMKRKQTGFLPEVQAPAIHSRERQRGKNWEKVEEDILVEAKGKDMDWKSISECLKSKGFTRDHRHCSDKWYALRKHYIEIQQWMIQNPYTKYWDLTDSERIRTVPSSFCQRWYEIFDAAHHKPEVRKRVRQNLNPRRRPDCGQRVAATDPSPSHSGPAVGSLSLDSLPRSDPAFAARPSCQLSVPHEASQRYAGDRVYAGDAAYESERREAPGKFLPNQATVEYSNLPFADIGVLWAEIRDLSHTLRQKFAAEEEERIRNMAIKEKKLQLKVERFHYKRQRDEEMRKRPGLMSQSCRGEGF